MDAGAEMVGAESSNCNGHCASAEMARASVDSLAEVLKEAAQVGQNLIDQRERYAAVAGAAVDLLGVLEAHVSLMDEKSKSRLNADLKARGLKIDNLKSLLGLIARKEG